MLIHQDNDVIVDLADLGGKAVLTYVHNKATPRSEVWKRVCDTLTARGAFARPENVVLLAITDGGSPAPDDRKLMDSLLGEHVRRSRFSIVSDAPILRFVVANLLLLNPRVKVFGTSDFAGAAEFAGLTAGDVANYRKGLDAIRPPLGQFKSFDTVMGRK